ncbi:MAG: hypothetical protein M0036_04810 [Desulfobacteraceae bacterium]|nr:hypothetical protein [Desulfobacteraceae bacterium]
MEDTRLKKIIVAATLGVALLLWWMHHPRVFQTSGSGLQYRYLIKTVGSGCDNPPLIFALHGNGDTPSNFYKTLLQDLRVPARIVLMEAPLPHATGHAWPMGGDPLRLHGEGIAEMVQILSKKYGSVRKPILLGFSGGGCMAYYQAAIHPELYSMIIPISGYLDGTVKPKPGGGDVAMIKALHATDDSLINFSSGRGAVEVLREAGREAEMIPLSGGHLAVFNGGHAALLEVLKNALK